MFSFVSFKETNFRRAFNIKILKGWITIRFCQFTINLKDIFIRKLTINLILILNLCGFYLFTLQVFSTLLKKKKKNNYVKV